MAGASPGTSIINENFIYYEITQSLHFDLFHASHGCLTDHLSIGFERSSEYYDIGCEVPTLLHVQSLGLSKVFPSVSEWL